jgi:2-polyprenyl-6-hydroxyphenyl methylase/3-demethylubiquinone-9 3-methyltransferase
MTPRNDQTIYERAAPHWWSGTEPFLHGLRGLVGPRLDYFQRVVSDWRGKVVLDLGCGGGFMTEALAERGADVVGVDPCAEAIEAARAHAAAGGLPVRYEVGAAENVPLADAAVDAVVCVDVLEHVTDLPGCCREIARVLRPGGVLLFDTVNRTGLARLLLVRLGEDLLGLLPRGTHDPALFIPPAHLRALLTSCGLRCGRWSGFGPVGIDRRGNVRFGLWPVLTVMYIGAAVKPPAAKTSL